MPESDKNDEFSDINAEKAGLIISVRLSRIEHGVHETIPEFIVSLPDGSLKQHVLKPLVFEFDESTGQGLTTQEIREGWAQGTQ